MCSEPRTLRTAAMCCRAFLALLFAASVVGCGGADPAMPAAPSEQGLAAPGTSAASTSESIYTESGKLTRADEAVTSLGPDLFGDKVNLYNGTVEFVQNDFAIPGNSALPMGVSRRLTTGTMQPAGGIFGDWDLEIPRLQGVFASATGWTIGGGFPASESGKRCSKFRAPPQVLGQSNQGLFNPEEYWHGSSIYVPGQGSQEMLLRNSSTPYPTDGAPASAYPVVTKQHWVFKCLSTMARGTGEGFIAISPDGTQYQFDWMVTRYYPVVAKPTVEPTSLPTGVGEGVIRPNVNLGYLLQRSEVWILPTVITDRFGNKVRYTYDSANPWQLKSIQDSDTASSPRLITFNYTAGTNLVSSISQGNRKWDYSYRTITGGSALSGVKLPDGSKWTFNLDALTVTGGLSLGGGSCDGDISLNGAVRTGTIDHPSGARGTFKIAGTQHGRSHVERQCRGNPADGDWSYFPLYIDAFSLQSKTIGGPGLPDATWSYQYGPANASFSPCSGCPTTKTVTVTDPRDVATRYTFGNRHRVNEGQLLQIDEGWNGSTALRTVVRQYRAAGATGYADPVGTSPQSRQQGELAYRLAPEERKVTTQQGATFSWSGSGWDSFARPTLVTRASSLGDSRTEALVYFDQTAKWVLGQTQSVTETGTGLAMESHDYQASTGNRIASYSFGRLVNRFDYYADGTLKSRLDPLGRGATFSNYKRGLAQNVAYVGGGSESASVDDSGLITWVINAAGTKTSYGYDLGGRLSLITPPADTGVTYNPTQLAFVPVSTAEFGLAGGHWRQTVSTGNARTERYFDALWRPRLTVTYDNLNKPSTSRAVLQRYDIDGRVTFRSLPQRSFSSVDGPATGTTNTYDGLGRRLLQKQDSELGVLTTTTEYLSGFKRRVTNPRGHASTTEFQAFDVPSEDTTRAVDLPAGIGIDIDRDIFGKPRSITRSGTWTGGSQSLSRRYVYDAYQRLCKTVEPESGATVQAYDGANNLQWKASGLTLTSLVCDPGSVPAARKVSYGYDARNRLISTTYGDGSPSISRNWTPDGLPSVVSSAGSTWNYGYNNRRLLKSETLSYGGSTYGFMWGIDSNGKVSSLSYPDGGNVAYSPNALGEAQAASGHASSVRYHPSGAVAGYTLANGIVHSMTPNLRGLPETVSEAGVVQDVYNYDANGNVGSITDQLEGLATRSMGYDALDRLTTANGIWGTGGFTYDVLDNIRTSAIGARKLTHNYDTGTNRFSGVTDSAVVNIGYDANGNITSRGTQGFTFDIGNRMASATGKASYVYDGHGRRLKVNYADGSSKLQMYSLSGKLLYGAHSSQGSVRYVYLGDKLISEVSSTAGTSYHHNDVLGSPVARTGSGGQLLSRTRYEPYGATIAGVNPTTVGFTGHLNDADTGLVYMQQRYYEPYAGRFLSVDPVTTDANTGNAFGRYHYANNSPYRYVDQDGREPHLISDCSYATQCQSYGGGSASGNSGSATPPASAAGAPTQTASQPWSEEAQARAIDILLLGIQVAPNTAALGTILRLGRSTQLAAKGIKPGGYSVAFETTIAKTGAGTREAHKAAANRDLAGAMSDKEFGHMLSSLGVKSVGGSGTPVGFRWHHAKDRPGTMQLVPEAQHTSGSIFQDMLHPSGIGGFAQWGRGW